MVAQELATTVGNDVSLPDYLAKYSEVGKEDIDKNELKIPRIAVAQFMSDVCKKQLVKFGDFYDTISHTIFGSALKIVIVKQFVDYQKFENGKLLGRSTDGVNWQYGSLAGRTIASTFGTTKDGKPEELWMFKQYNFYCFVPGVDAPLPYLFTLTGTSAKEGSKLYNLLAQNLLVKKVPPFGRIYSVTSEKRTNDAKQEYAVIVVTEEKGNTPKELVERAVEMRNVVEKSKEVFEESLVKDAAATPGNGNF